VKLHAPERTASMAGSASGFMRTNHCFERRGSTTGVATVAMAHRMLVILDLLQQATRLEIRDQALAASKRSSPA
jgi:hypothetical protein